MLLSLMSLQSPHEIGDALSEAILVDVLKRSCSIHKYWSIVFIYETPNENCNSHLPITLVICYGSVLTLEDHRRN